MCSLSTRDMPFVNPRTQLRDLAFAGESTPPSVPTTPVATGVASPGSYFLALLESEFQSFLAQDEACENGLPSMLDIVLLPDAFEILGPKKYSAADQAITSA